jgi:hypothetical protein
VTIAFEFRIDCHGRMRRDLGSLDRMTGEQQGPSDEKEERDKFIIV